MSTRSDNLSSIIEHKPLGGFRMRIFIVCFLIVLMDGFDTQAIGFAAKSISSALSIPMPLFGTVFSVGLLGTMLGAFILGPMADRYGRRKPLFGAVVIFGAFTLLTAYATSFNELLVCRFLAGLGLGGAIPNLLTLSSDYAPSKIKGQLTGILYAAFPIGGAAGAFLSAQIAPIYGWQALFYVGGVLPFILAVVVLTSIPESMQYMLKQGMDQDAIKAIARRIKPDADLQGTLTMQQEIAPSGGVARELFSPKHLWSTLLLWIGFFMSFVLLIVLVLWTPALLRELGLEEKHAAIVVGLVNIGAVIGTALGGKLLDKFGPLLLLPILFVSGALSVSALGYVGSTFLALSVFAAMSGFFVAAGQSGLMSLAVLTYPSAIRGTGVGWAIGIGRMGQVTGPLIIGALLGAGASIHHLFYYCTIPAAVAAIATGLLRFAHRSKAQGHMSTAIR